MEDGASEGVLKVGLLVWPSQKNFLSAKLSYWAKGVEDMLLEGFLQFHSTSLQLVYLAV